MEVGGERRRKKEAGGGSCCGELNSVIRQCGNSLRERVFHFRSTRGSPDSLAREQSILVQEPSGMYYHQEKRTNLKEKIDGENNWESRADVEIYGFFLYRCLIPD
jgi:hypothetical protein